jgi:hypothetical protein
MKTMTNEEMRISIAEWVGWKYKLFDSMDGGSYGWVKGDNFPCDIDTIPNYPEDLNAMHEAEKKLSRLERIAYMRRLRLNAIEHDPENHITNDEANALCFATSQQRSEALCRVILPERFETMKGEA